MVNSEIYTAMKNSIDRGESLDYASEILINSGYAKEEVEETKKFFTSGIISNNLKQKPVSSSAYQAVTQQTTQTTQVTQSTQVQNKPSVLQTTYSQNTPINQKPVAQPMNAAISNRPMPNSPPQKIIPIQRQAPAMQPQMQPIIQPVVRIAPPVLVQERNSMSNDVVITEQEISKVKRGYGREIFLMLILIILVGLLIATFLFKDKIILFFNAMSS